MSPEQASGAPFVARRCSSHEITPGRRPLFGLCPPICRNRFVSASGDIRIATRGLGLKSPRSPVMDSEFQILIGRVRAGEPEAAEALVRQYESAIRVAIRARLFDRRLRRQLDSLDICQSVLASFFVRAAAGHFELQRPAQLVALLTKMAHNKLAWHVRFNSQQRRNYTRLRSHDQAASHSAARDGDPARQVEARELLDRTWQSMDGELRDISSRRLAGQTWAQIAAGIGGTASARRKQFERGLDRIAQLLEIDDGLTYAR